MVALNFSNRLWFSSRKTLAAIALSCGSLIFSGVAPANYAFAQSASDAQADVQIEGAVQHQLATAPGINGQKITAATNNGVVTLSGSVTDEVSRQLAENAVSSVAGVKNVQNNLSVGNLPAPVPADQAAADPAPVDQTQQNQPQAEQAPPTQAQPVPPGASQNATGQNATGPNGGWGPAGPPPDAVNGQVPAQPTAPASGTTSSGTTYGAAPAQSYPQPGYSQQGYPQQGGYPDTSNNYPPQNGQYPARPAYRSSAPRPYVQPTGPITIPAGTLLTVRLQNYIDARHVKPGDIFVANASRDVFQNGVLAVPYGATLEGHVISVKKPGAFSGGGELQVQLSALYLNGQAFPIATDVFSTQTPGKGGYSAANTIGGTVFGALIGAAVGGGPGAAVGAVAGGVTGAAVSSATPAPRSFIPAETLITFHLSGPATIQPVSLDEATRLAASMPRPVLRPRPVYYGPPRGYYGYPYPY